MLYTPGYNTRMQARSRIQLVDIITGSCQRIRGCTMKCWKIVWWVSNDSETRCAVWQSIAPPHSDTLSTDHRRTRPANCSFATFSNDNWAFRLTQYLVLSFINVPESMKCYKDGFSSLLRLSYDASGISIGSPRPECLSQVFCRLTLRTSSSSLSRRATAPLAEYAAFARSSPLRSTDDTLGSRNLLKLKGFLPAGAQGRRLAYFTSIYYFYSCATGSIYNQAQTRGDSTSTQEALVSDKLVPDLPNILRSYSMRA